MKDDDDRLSPNQPLGDAGAKGDAGQNAHAKDAHLIKKYANRRLYDTRASRYITLDDLSAMVRAGRDFRVVDARTDADITAATLTQIIVDDQARGQGFLPIAYLRQLIALYGNQVAPMMPPYLEASMDALRAHQRQLADAIAGSMDKASPLAELTRANMAMFANAAAAFMPGASPGRSADAPGEPVDGPATDPTALRAEIARLERALAAARAEIASLTGPG